MTAISEELSAALLNLKSKLEALPEPLRGPFVVEGLKPYLRSGNGGEVRGLPSVDELSQIIRHVDGNHSLGAGDLAERILSALDIKP